MRNSTTVIIRRPKKDENDKKKLINSFEYMLDKTNFAQDFDR